MTIPTTTPTATEAAGTNQIAMTRQAATLLAGLLEHCEEFLTQPGVRTDLADFCTRQPMVTSGWLIDMLAWHALHLRARVDDLDHTHAKETR